MAYIVNTTNHAKDCLKKYFQIRILFLISAIIFFAVLVKVQMHSDEDPILIIPILIIPILTNPNTLITIVYSQYIPVK